MNHDLIDYSQMYTLIYLQPINVNPFAAMYFIFMAENDSIRETTLCTKTLSEMNFIYL